MIQEKPLLGHGTGLTSKERTPYYENLGLGQMEKKYEAHNTYLQIWTEGGVFALLSFVAWLIATLALINRSISDRFDKFAFAGSLVTLAVASLTQNSIQDSEVRFTLMVVLCCLYFKLARVQSPLED
jgi:O-antigen ligase